MVQFEAARRVKTDDDCMVYLQALRAENTSLLKQSHSLKTGFAKIYAEVKVVRDATSRNGAKNCGIGVKAKVALDLLTIEPSGK